MEVLSINILKELVRKYWWNDELNPFKLYIKELILIVKQNSMIFCWMTQAIEIRTEAENIIYAFLTFQKLKVKSNSKA